MTKNILKYISFVVFLTGNLSLCEFAKATESTSTSMATYSREQVTDLALEKSPIVQRARAMKDEARWKKIETYNGFLPTISMSAQHLLSKEYQYVDMNLGSGSSTVAQIIPSNMWSLNASLPLFEGFQSVQKTRAAMSAEDAAINDYSWTRFKVSHEVQLKYDQALASQALLSVAKQNVLTLTEHLNQARALHKGGITTSYDVLRVEVQLNEAQSELLKTEDDLAIAMQKLTEAIGNDVAIENLSGVLSEPKEELVEKIKKLKKSDFEQRQDLLALQQRYDASDLGQSAASSFWVPRVSLVGSWLSYNNRNDDMQDHDKYRWAYTVGVNLYWNIFDGMGSIARSQQAYYQKIQVEKNWQQARLARDVDFDLWKRRSIYSASLYKAKLSDLEKTKESLRIAKEGYRAGVRTSSDVLDAELDLFKVRAGVVNSQLNYAEAISKLEMSIGRNLSD